MKEIGRGCQCPFLNRSDARCSQFFTLSRVGHVYEHCFDEYGACATFHELMAERHERVLERAHARAVLHDRDPSRTPVLATAGEESHTDADAADLSFGAGRKTSTPSTYPQVPAGFARNKGEARGAGGGANTSFVQVALPGRDRKPLPGAA